VESPNFKMIAPSDNYNRIVKALQQYKIDPIVKVTWWQSTRTVIMMIIFSSLSSKCSPFPGPVKCIGCFGSSPELSLNHSCCPSQNTPCISSKTPLPHPCTTPAAPSSHIITCRVWAGSKHQRRHCWFSLFLMTLLRKRKWLDWGSRSATPP